MHFLSSSCLQNLAFPMNRGGRKIQKKSISSNFHSNNIDKWIVYEDTLCVNDNLNVNLYLECTSCYNEVHFQ